MERTRYDLWSTIWKLLVFFGFVVIALTIVRPRYGLVLTVLVILAGLWTYVSLVSRGTGYRCGKCGKVFQVPTAVNFFTVSQVGKNPDGTYYSYKPLTCPHCGKRSMARVVKRADERAARGTGRMLR